MGVNVRVDGVMVLAGAAVAGGALLYFNRNKIASAVDPNSHDNLAYQAAVAAGIEDPDARGYTPGDYFFGWIDLWNPLNESDQYAHEIYGISDIFGDDP